MKSTSMATNSPTLSAENRGNFVWSKKMYVNQHTLKKKLPQIEDGMKFNDWMENQIG
jgi:hypothetical protein